jgi:hypothetical protein
MKDKEERGIDCTLGQTLPIGCHRLRQFGSTSPEQKVFWIADWRQPRYWTAMSKKISI